MAMFYLALMFYFINMQLPQDPCAETKAAAESATAFSKDSIYLKALSAIRSAATGGKEHSISFGIDADRNILPSVVSAGDQHSSRVPGVANRFADLHNHLDNSPPFSGDVYGFIQSAINSTLYKTRYITTENKTVYALTIADFQKAKIFLVNYPPIPNPGYQPRFPDEIVDEFRALKYGKSLAEEMAIAFILEKYNTGVALLKQDGMGVFKRLHTRETIDDAGNKIYTENNCR